MFVFFRVGVFSTNIQWLFSSLDVRSSSLAFTRKRIDSLPNNNMLLDEELDIMVSIKLIRLENMPNMLEKGYTVTSPGKLAIAYLNEVA